MRPLNVIKGEIRHAFAELFEQDEDVARELLRTLAYTEVRRPDPFETWMPEPDGRLHGFYYVRKRGTKADPELIYVDGDDGPEVFRVYGPLGAPRRIEELLGDYEFNCVAPYPP